MLSTMYGRATILVCFAACHRGEPSGAHEPPPVRRDPEERPRASAEPVDATPIDAPGDVEPSAPDPDLPDSACPSPRDVALWLGASARPWTPPVDLDGDGKTDPVFIVGDDAFKIAFLYIDRGGCRQQLGAVHFNASGSSGVAGRSKNGWAILVGVSHFTFNEDEERAEYDGSKYAISSRKRERNESGGQVAPGWRPWTKYP